MATIITIDGSHGEGGGQILRNACTYAAILRKNIRIVNIRAGRKTPGLRPQHLVGLRLLEAVSGSCLAEGNHVGSTEILFIGSECSNKKNTSERNGSLDTQTREYIGDTKTAGSVCLLMQTVLPFALVRGIHRNGDDETLRFRFKGGTDAAFAPPLDYKQFVFLPVLCNYSGIGGGQMNAMNGMGEFDHAINMSLISRGFYPRGGGEVKMSIRRLPSKAFPLPPIQLITRGKIVVITIRSFASGSCPRSLAQKLSTYAQKMILSNPRYKNVPIKIELSPGQTPTGSLNRGKKRPRTSESGCGVLIVATSETGCLLGGSSMGSPKVPLEETARLAATEVIDAMDDGGCVDDYLQDQLIIYMALAGGVSEIVTNSLTMHTKTAMWLASKMLPSARFEVTKIGKVDDVERGKRSGDETEETPFATDRNIGTSEKDIAGRYRIRCHGIGFCPLPNK